MQMDLFEILNEEKLQAQNSLESERLQQRITEIRKALEWDEYVKLKAERALMVDANSLSWMPSYPNVSTSGYEHVDVKVIIPPDVLSPVEYYLRLDKSKRSGYHDDPLRDACREMWSSYNFAIWGYSPHRVDWCGATKLLTRHRDVGDPIWIRLSKIGERMIHGVLPDCIVEIKGEA